MFKPPASSPGRADAASNVKAWTKRRFSLKENDTVFVSELEGGAPGFPPNPTSHHRAVVSPDPDTSRRTSAAGASRARTVSRCPGRTARSLPVATS